MMYWYRHRLLVQLIRELRIDLVMLRRHDGMVIQVGICNVVKLVYMKRSGRILSVRDGVQVRTIPLFIVRYIMIWN
jgi:hypothetical protein